MKWFIFLSLFNLLVVSFAIDFEKALGSTSTCDLQCTNSYPPHTYPDGKDSDACQRGCRFYKITFFVSKDEPSHTNNIHDDGLSPSIHLCQDSCVEAYNMTSSLTVACKDGCSKQEAVTKKDSKDSGMDESPMHLLQPFMQVRRIASKMMGSIQIIQSSLITYFLSDDNSVVAMEGPTDIVVKLDQEHMNDDPAKKSNFIKDFFSQEEASKELVLSSEDSNGPQIVQTATLRFGIPPYLFVLSVAVVIVFLLYLMCSICSARGKEGKVQASTPIPTSALPIKLVRPEDLTKLSLLDDDDNMAPALPHKVKLPAHSNV